MLKISYFRYLSTIDINEIEKMVNILNERLTGVPIVELKNKIYKEVADFIKTAYSKL